MLSSRKFNGFDLQRKLTDKGWGGRYFGYNDTVTYLTNQNETIATVTYNTGRSLILSVKFEK